MNIDIRSKLVEVSRMMYQKGMVNAFEGNLSYLDGSYLYITPSGICKGFLNEEMITVTDLEGNIIEGNYKPSSEIKIHLECYSLRPDIKSVIHAHSPYATAYAIANKPIETKAYAEMIMLFGKVPLVKYGTPSTEDIYADLADYIHDYDVVLLANHGILSCGKDIFDAFFKLEAIEGIAKTLVISNLVGGEKDIDDDQLKILYEMKKSKNSKER